MYEVFQLLCDKLLTAIVRIDHQYVEIQTLQS